MKGFYFYAELKIANNPNYFGTTAS